MCGIAGILNPPGRPVDAADLRRMAAALARRGPDDEGFLIDGHLGLAHRRLAILDLSAAGRQPLANEDGSVVVAYNGQLYGFAPLRRRLEDLGHRFRSRTDTEVLVHLYEERGDDLVLDVDGMFAFAIWDSARQRLLLARDRLGIKPLYFVRHEGAFVFASELPALLALPWLPRDLDPGGVAQYLYQSSVPGNVAILAGYEKLGPGERLVIEAGRTRRDVYWSLSSAASVTSPPRSLDEAARELQDRLDAAVSSHLVADVPVGAFLSGGLDSTAVAEAVSRVTSGSLETFSVRFLGVPGADEGPHAGLVADGLGTVHHELVLGPEDLLATLPEAVDIAGEPFAISSGLALLRLARFARARVKVVLTGDGADEILAGYPWRHEPDTGTGATPATFVRGLAMTTVRAVRGARSGGPGLARQLAGRLDRMVRPDDRYAEIVAAFTPEELADVLDPSWHDIVLRAWEENPVRLRFRAVTTDDPVNRRLAVDLATTLVDEMLTKVDRMTMAAGLEARVPFLDRALVEWAFGLPGSLKVAGGTGKLVLRRALAASFPDTARRPKHGFNVPLGPWLCGPLAPLLRDTLLSATARHRGLLRPAAVERMLEAHLAGRGDHARKLFTLLVLEMWLARNAHAEPSRRRP